MSGPQPVQNRREEPVDSEEEDEERSTDAAGEGEQPGTDVEKKKKKKKSKKAKVASALGLKKDAAESSGSASKLSDSSIQTLMQQNPALRGELSNQSPEKLQELLRKMDVRDLLTGMSTNKGSQKDMASHKFWQTQPVTRFDEASSSQPDGPIKPVIPELVPKDPAALPDGYEWCEIDLTNDEELEEVYKLLTYHYVEDSEAMFRFNYSSSFLNWALKAPGWKKSWHVGVRAKGTKRLLVGCIFGIPTKLRVKDNLLDVVEINFLCIHKKLRSKRLAPVLIKEVTRRTHLEGIAQAIYTAGVVLPTPAATCRYFHRPLDWAKLNKIDFSPLPPNTTVARMVKRYELPSATSTPGWQQLEPKDTDQAFDLLSRYLRRFKIAQELTKDEFVHWLVPKPASKNEQTVWSYVVRDADGNVTDFASFYILESMVIGATEERYSKVRAAYLFYYASETAFGGHEGTYKKRLREIMNDLLIEAKNAGFDVVNGLTLQDNPLFLEDVKFGPGDGLLHFYLYNWRTSPVSGGIDKHNMPDQKVHDGVGIVML